MADVASFSLVGITAPAAFQSWNLQQEFLGHLVKLNFAISPVWDVHMSFCPHITLNDPPPNNFVLTESVYAGEYCFFFFGRGGGGVGGEEDFTTIKTWRCPVNTFDKILESCVAPSPQMAW